MSEIILLGEVGEKILGVKVFLAGGCREVIVIKDEVSEERHLVFSV